MSNALSGRGFLRAPRRGVEIHLGTDGRVQSEAEALEAAMLRPEVTTSAATIVELAQQRAEAIVRDAALSAAAVQQEAYNDGFLSGQREGIAVGRRELTAAITLVQHVASQTKAMRDQLLVQAEREIVELVIAATESIIGARVAMDEPLVHETVRRALERAGSQNVVRVRVSPEDLERVSIRLAEDRDSVSDFELLADGSVSVGGCIVDTEAGRVDARLDVQLGQVADLLRASMPVTDDDWVETTTEPDNLWTSDDAR